MLGGPIPQGHAPWFPPSPFRTQFAKLRHLGCSFLVAGRCDSEGRFLTLANLEVPEVLPRGGLFEEIPASEFRADVSSTELRRLGL
jgi:hypothetical protein